MGFDPLLGRRPRHRRPHDKRPFGDGSRETLFQARLQGTPVPDTGGGLLRVAKDEWRQATPLHSDEERATLRLRRARGGLEGDGNEIRSCTILTTNPNDIAGEIHNRMPVILPPEGYEVWLYPDVRETDQLLSLLAPYPPSDMEAYPVSRRVNSPSN